MAVMLLAPEARRSDLRPERLRRAGRVRRLGLGLWRVSVATIAVAGVVLLALGGLGPVSGRTTRGDDSVRATEAGRAAARAVERSELAFLPDPGLPDDGSRFVARGPGYGIALTPDEVRVAGPSSPAPLRMRLVGARADAAGRGELPGPGRTNLILGDDPARWRTGVASFGRVTYEGVWDGIDVVYHGRGAQLEQDFVVSPGADPDAISMSFDAADGLRLASNGDLVVALPGGEVRLGRPTLYQEVDGRRRPVQGTFALRDDNRVGFRVGPHDRTRPLVIDPVLLESTYLGGSSSDSAFGVAVDDAGNVYVTGFSESTDFPTASPQQAALAEDAGVRTDAFVSKLNPNGDGFVYSTFLGGKARDTGHSVAVGVDGSATVAGYTESSDFPLARPMQKSFGGGPSDAFVARISPEGAVLQYSTYLGGSGTDTARGVALSQSGDAYLAGSTTSGNFPLAGTPVRGTLTAPDDSDAFVTRVNPAGSALVYSTYLGGNGEDHALGIALDPVGNAYVSGDTRSPDLPTVKAFQPGLGGGLPGIGGADADAFVSKLDPNGSSLVYSTYLGGSESDQGASIAVDGTGNAYVTGSTGSTNFPVVRPAQPRKNGDFDAFVAKLSPDGPLFWSTYLGGSASDGGGGVTVDSGGRASVTGAAASADFPTVKPFQPSKAGGFVDGFVATYDEAGAALTQSSYLGGREDDQGTSIAVDADGNLHVTGYTNSSDFPTAKPFQPAKGGGVGDVFVATVGEPAAAAEAGGASSSPGRDRRIRFFMGVTIALFLAAVGQTLWLRRRPAIGPPAPAGVGDLAVTRVEPDWYAANRPPPLRLSDVTPVRPRPVPPPPPPPRRPRPAPRADASRPDEVVVPDLLPEGDKGVWAPAPGSKPAEADAKAPVAEDKTAQVPAVDAQLPPPPPPPIDVAAPDLWGPSEPEPDLTDDSVWWELLGADPSAAGSFPPPPSRPTPPPPRALEVDAVADDPAVADALAAEAEAAGLTAAPAGKAPAPAPSVEAPAPSVEAPAAEAPAPTVEAPAVQEPEVEKPAVEEPEVDKPAVEGPEVEEPAVEGPEVEEPTAEAPSPPDVPVVEPVATDPAPPAPTEAEVVPSPLRDDVVVGTTTSPVEAEVEPEILVPAPAPAPPQPAGDEPAVPEEAAQDPDDWTAALWGPPGPPKSEPAGPEADAGVPGTAEDERPAEGPADLSISDLLAEDLPIPEAEERALSIRDLLAEDLVAPDPEAASSEAPPAAETPAPPVAVAPSGPPAEESAGADSDGTDEDPPDDEPPPPPPPSRPSRPLPEAAPGRSLGGRLRRAWQAHGRES